MAVSNSFGRRDAGNLWGARSRPGAFVCLSTGRSAIAAGLSAAVAVLSGWVALRTTLGLLPDAGAPVLLRLTLAPAAAGLAGSALWATLALMRGLSRKSPLLRLDASRLVICTRSGHLVLAWEDVRLRLGPVFAEIAVGPGARLHGVTTGRRFLVPILLIDGGPNALRQAIRRVRPDVLASA
jgi:hypothetical protein